MTCRHTTSSRSRWRRSRRASPGFGYSQGVEFVPGLFADTLRSLPRRPWALVRVDGDTYEATRLTLEALYPGVVRGGYVVIDDYGALEECSRAVDEFRDREGIVEPLEEVDWTCVRWRRESEPDRAGAAG